MNTHRTALLAATLACATVLAACGRPDPAAGGDTSTPHGYVEGAQEQAEAQNRLVYAAVDGDRPRMLDLASEKTQPLGPRRDERVQDLTGDGRFVYVAPESDAGVRVLDSGVWTVEHGDHHHYYTAVPAALGAVRGQAPGSVAGSAAGAAVVFEGDGEVAVLSREALDDGELDLSARVDVGPHAGVAVPYREHVVVSTASSTGRLADGVEVVGVDGKRVQALDVACPDLRGHAVARTGVLFGCADGLLLVTEGDGVFDAEKIGYPAGTSAADRATSLHVRPGSNAVAASGDGGVWVVDPSARTARLIATEQPPVAVASPGDDRSVLVLRRDGVLEARSVTDGQVLASRPVLSGPVDPAAGPAPVIEVDLARAYVNDAAGDRIVEIDHADDLRVARTLATEVTPHFMTEVGR
ncbi:hypothetical protein [Solicola sp. PLA-1-18]|uniref:hypothetical protein n=1 Tax=Solicola sp. PLA-1-18 TaxID=3380532 RepID=UPI003B826A01